MSLPGPIWIDLANSPHVLFFRPVIMELHRRGIATFCTARDFAQTVPLCQKMGLEVQVVGAHGGAGVIWKARELRFRVSALRAAVHHLRPAAALSHNSYAQVLAARSLGIRAITAMDYEFQPANHLAFRAADLIAVPKAFPLDRLRAQGARKSKVWRYPGLKEHIALAGFKPNPDYLRAQAIDTTMVVVVVRPPASMALYHRFENPLFAVMLRHLQRMEGLSVVLLPRTLAQAKDLETAGFGDMLWRREALDGRQLVAGADVVVSAGGSMNREAAVLGTPAWSVYAGKLGAVDRTLVADGRLALLSDHADVEGLDLRKKKGFERPVVSSELLQLFVDRILVEMHA